MSSLPLVIINPASAAGATAEEWPRIASDLRSHFGPFNCAFTEGVGDGRRIAEREARAGRTFIIACGGDGTISEVANGILQSGAAAAELGVLPSGTGGDFRRSLRIQTRARDAARALRTGRTRLMDAVRVWFQNGEGAEEMRYFVNVASFGMGGAVIRRVKEGGATLAGAHGTRLLGGRASFAAAALRTAIEFTKPSVEIQLDGGRPTRLLVANLCVANARYFGGGMMVAPDAKLNDGLLDVVAIGDLSALQLLANSYRIYMGTYLGMQEVRHARARKVAARAVEAAESVLLEIDGELAGHLPATFEIVPRSLKVRCPN